VSLKNSQSLPSPRATVLTLADSEDISSICKCICIAGEIEYDQHSVRGAAWRRLGACGWKTQDRLRRRCREWQGASSIALSTDPCARCSSKKLPRLWPSSDVSLSTSAMTAGCYCSAAAEAKFDGEPYRGAHTLQLQQPWRCIYMEAIAYSYLSSRCFACTIPRVRRDVPNDSLLHM
jgi:hypothetical protein